jgi:hypothetical protein
VLDHGLSILKIEREDVMAYRICNDRVVVIQGPVGYKRTYVFPGASPSAELRAGFDTPASPATQDEPVEG